MKKIERGNEKNGERQWRIWSETRIKMNRCSERDGER